MEVGYKPTRAKDVGRRTTDRRTKRRPAVDMILCSRTDYVSGLYDKTQGETIRRRGRLGAGSGTMDMVYSLRPPPIVRPDPVADDYSSTWEGTGTPVVIDNGTGALPEAHF